MFGAVGMLLAGLFVAGVVFPLTSQVRRNRITRAWSRTLLRLCGMRLRVTGVPLDAQLAADGMAPWTLGRLVLANHISWIDIFSIDAAIPCRFVAKAEIADWPVAGWMVTKSGVLYVERGRRHAVAAINRRVRDCLRAGETVAVFPEGTTTDGSTLQPFHSNIVAPALDCGCEIWPVALRYTEDGAPSTAAAFVGDMNLVTCLWNVFRAHKLEVEVAFLPPLRPAPGQTRHHLTDKARAAIAVHLGVAVAEPTSAPAPDSPGTPPAAAPAAASAAQ